MCFYWFFSFICTTSRSRKDGTGQLSEVNKGQRPTSPTPYDKSLLGSLANPLIVISVPTHWVWCETWVRVFLFLYLYTNVVLYLFFWKNLWLSALICNSAASVKVKADRNLSSAFWMSGFNDYTKHKNSECKRSGLVMEMEISLVIILDCVWNEYVTCSMKGHCY